MNEELQQHSCIDEPRNTDYKFSEWIGAEKTINSNVFWNKTGVQNQGLFRTPSTAYACTCFGISHCINEGNAIAEEIEETKGEELWMKALELGAGVNSGWSLQGALDLAMSKNHISGYTKCETVDEVKQALNNSQLVYTGSKSINWRATRDNGNVVVPGEAYGHCFAIFGYDDLLKVFICKNSYGEEAYDKGYFYVKYEDFNIFFSKYAIVDKEGEKKFTEKRVRALQASYPNKLPSNDRRAQINDLNAQWKYKEAYDLLKYCLKNEQTFDS